MFLRIFSVLLIATAMLAAPLTMRDGMAMAAAPAAHHADAAEMPSHCDDRGTSKHDQTHKARGDNCCIATCVAVMAPMGSETLVDVHPLVLRPASDADRIGTLAEIATPPPRPA
jgi:hypothetical protein